MKKYSLLIFIMLGCFTSLHSQIFSNDSPAAAIKLCKTSNEVYSLTGNEDYCTKSLYYYFYVTNAQANLFNFQSSSSGILTVYKIPGNTLTFEACTQLENGQAIVDFNQLFTTSSFSFGVSQAGLYIVRLMFNECSLNPTNEAPELNFTFSSMSGEVSCPENEVRIECKDCITSFSPTAGKYMVSAWVKEDGASMNTTTYSNVSIEISFSGNGSTYSLLPSGRIIDGWQRIEGVIDVSTAATDIHLSFETATGTAYFDDIRFYPLDGSMVSYVYDPINLRLMAQLDERNYATFYEYDEEGKLIRVKKETERGVMTIQENRDNIIKK